MKSTLDASLNRAVLVKRSAPVKAGKKKGGKSHEH
jgi:hypothetical protein